MRDTLVIDTGQDIVGVYSVADDTYVSYRGEAKLTAVERIRRAAEVVTYNGNNRDLSDLRHFAGVEPAKDLGLCGIHTDMREICYPGFWGTNLPDTYRRFFSDQPDFGKTYEGSNRLDVYMTFKLWELWTQGNLTTVHGDYIPPRGT